MSLLEHPHRPLLQRHAMPMSHAPHPLLSGESGASTKPRVVRQRWPCPLAT